MRRDGELSDGWAFFWVMIGLPLAVVLLGSMGPIGFVIVVAVFLYAVSSGGGGGDGGGSNWTDQSRP